MSECAMLSGLYFEKKKMEFILKIRDSFANTQKKVPQHHHQRLMKMESELNNCLVRLQELFNSLEKISVLDDDQVNKLITGDDKIPHIFNNYFLDCR